MLVIAQHPGIRRPPAETRHRHQGRPSQPTELPISPTNQRLVICRWVGIDEEQVVNRDRAKAYNVVFRAIVVVHDPNSSLPPPTRRTANPSEDAALASRRSA